MDNTNTFGSDYQWLQFAHCSWLSMYIFFISIWKFGIRLL